MNEAFSKKLLNRMYVQNLTSNNSKRFNYYKNAIEKQAINKASKGESISENVFWDLCKDDKIIYLLNVHFTKLGLTFHSKQELVIDEIKTTIRLSGWDFE